MLRDLAEFLFLKQSGSLNPNTSKKERESMNSFKYMIEKQWSFDFGVMRVRKYTKTHGINQLHCR